VNHIAKVCQTGDREKSTTSRGEGEKANKQTRQTISAMDAREKKKKVNKIQRIEGSKKKRKGDFLGVTNGK
jgi:hypothetical protein